MAVPDEWQRYVGCYREPGGIEVEVKIVTEGLVAALVGGGPGTSIGLIPEGERTFRMKGGPAAGELMVFDVDESGKVVQIRVSGTHFQRK